MHMPVQYGFAIQVDPHKDAPSLPSMGKSHSPTEHRNPRLLLLQHAAQDLPMWFLVCFGIVSGL